MCSAPNGPFIARDKDVKRIFLAVGLALAFLAAGQLPGPRGGARAGSQALGRPTTQRVMRSVVQLVAAREKRSGLIVPQWTGNDSCVPIGGFINALRPMNLARSLIEAAQRGLVRPPPPPRERWRPMAASPTRKVARAFAGRPSWCCSRGSAWTPFAGAKMRSTPGPRRTAAATSSSRRGRSGGSL